MSRFYLNVYRQYIFGFVDLQRNKWARKSENAVQDSKHCVRVSVLNIIP